MTRSQKIWGPIVWRLLHSVCHKYDQKSEKSFNAVTFLVGLSHILPCKHCRETYTMLLCIDKPLDVVEKGESLFFWSYQLHERVNKKLWAQDHPDVPYKPQLSYEDAQRRYARVESVWADDVFYFYKNIMVVYYTTATPWYYITAMALGTLLSDMDPALAAFKLPEDDPTYQYDTFKSKKDFEDFVEKCIIFTNDAKHTGAVIMCGDA